MASFLTPLDIAAVLWFFALWTGYNLIADGERLRRQSLIGLMHEHRSRWMKQMLRRDMRMLDALILNHLQSGNGLFASTSILVVGGLAAALGSTDEAVAALSALPFVGETTRLEWEAKVLLLMLIFVYAFFKFIWSYRLYGFCAVLVGAVPEGGAVDADAERRAQQAAKIGNLAALHQNRGLRAFYFALAALVWLAHPILLMVAATWVVVVLYRRDFRSRSLRIVRGDA